MSKFQEWYEGLSASDKTLYERITDSGEKTNHLKFENGTLMQMHTVEFNSISPEGVPCKFNMWVPVVGE